MILLIAIFAGQSVSAQEQKYDWKAMKPEQRKQIIQKMSPEERISLLKQFRENMIVSQLDVQKSDQTEFKTLYAEYQDKQNEIKSKFNSNQNYENMNDEEAKKQLNLSFEVGQQLLDNRKAYAEKFLKVISPQQLLQMYQTEGKIRNKILDRKQDGSENSAPQRRRP
ncbi:hypothetical protein [Chryseobacterium sp. R2A-55]|uniref:hypothetical protein n=1 Tax=Chryseobacterium sp. R2A-55 TaxID=2744445 RepID=UPI001F44E0D1|nr:hypothetical protein [Chryseobacterium sp. R2A-55]